MNTSYRPPFYSFYSLSVLSNSWSHSAASSSDDELAGMVLNQGSRFFNVLIRNKNKSFSRYLIKNNLKNELT